MNCAVQEKAVKETKREMIRIIRMDFIGEGRICILYKQRFYSNPQLW